MVASSSSSFPETVRNVFTKMNGSSSDSLLLLILAQIGIAFFAYLLSSTTFEAFMGEILPSQNKDDHYSFVLWFKIKINVRSSS